MGACHSAAAADAPGPWAESSESSRQTSTGLSAPPPVSAPPAVSADDDAVGALRVHAEAGRFEDALGMLQRDPGLLRKLLEQQLESRTRLEEEVAKLETANRRLRLQHPPRWASSGSSLELPPAPAALGEKTIGDDGPNAAEYSTGLPDPEVFDIDDLCLPFEWVTEEDSQEIMPEEAEAKAKAEAEVHEEARKVAHLLLWSSMQGDLGGIRAALCDGADPNTCDGQFGISALSFSAINGGAEAVAALLSARADPLQPDRLGILPLHRAVRGRFEDVAKKLVESMTQRPAGLENVERVAAMRFAECLGIAVDSGWTDLSVALHAWWAEAEAPPVVARWLELRRLATIRAAAKFLPGLLRAGGPRAFLRAVEVAPELLELMLDCGADPGAQVPVEVPEHIELYLNDAPACKTGTALMATDLAQACGDHSAVKLLKSRGAAVRKIGAHLRGLHAAGFGTESVPQIVLAASSLRLVGNGSAMSSATSLQTSKMRALNELSVSGYSIGPKELLSIAQCAGLQTLNLSDNSIGAEIGAKQLAKALRVNRVILTLNLYNNGIGAEGCKALAEALSVNGTLQRLNLYNNGIGTEGCEALAEALSVNVVLKTINLGSNSIGVEGGRALARALQVNKHLRSINLRYNAISADGGRALAEALHVNRSLETLDVRNNAIGQEGGKALNGALKVNSSLKRLEMSNYTAIQGLSDSIEGRSSTAQQHDRLRAVLKVRQSSGEGPRP